VQLSERPPLVLKGGQAFPHVAVVAGAGIVVISDCVETILRNASPEYSSTKMRVEGEPVEDTGEWIDPFADLKF